MNTSVLRIFAVGLIFAVTTLASSQSLLEDDTLYIGDAVGSKGEQVVVPVYIKTSVDYQGWQIPVKFGSGATPVFCDSVSLQNSCMNHYPHEWDFKAAFKNNNQWSGVQTCGVAGVADLYPPYEPLPPGYWHVMDLCFTIDSSAVDQEIGLDTTTCSWYNGGPLNAYIVSVNAQSYVTVVVPGKITVLNTSVKENAAVGIDRELIIYPTVISPGAEITARIANPGYKKIVFKIADVTGRVVGRHSYQPTGSTSRCTMIMSGLSRGIYMMIAEDGSGALVGQQKIIVR
jgi:hypothetical protein